MAVETAMHVTPIHPTPSNTHTPTILKIRHKILQQPSSTNAAVVRGNGRFLVGWIADVNDNRVLRASGDTFVSHIDLR